MNDTLILIPAHNEEATIGTLLHGLHDAGVDKIADILVVDDCSDDRTGVIVRASGVQVVRNVFNLGYGSALQLGYKYAVRRNYDYVIQMDADGQHDICNVFTIYDCLRQPNAECDGHMPDIVIGSRFCSGSITFPISSIKRLAMRIFSSMIRLLTGKHLRDTTSGLQGLNRGAFLFYSRFNNFNARYPDANMIVQMLMLGFHVIEIPSVMHERIAGESMHHGIFKPIFYMMVMFVSIATVAWREKKHPDKVPVIDPNRSSAC